jgi:acyl-CoA thioester hydrolase
MHSHRVRLRWADLDSYHHINNVRYLDFAAEVRQRLADEGALGADRPVGSITINYLQPLHLRAKAVTVRTQIDGDQLNQVITAGDSDTTHANLVTTLGRAAAPRPTAPGDYQHLHEVNLRMQDVGPDGCVSVERLADLLQELRIEHRSALDRDRAWGKSVVASVTLDVFGDVRRGAPGLRAVSWVPKVGRSSYVSQSELRDDQQVLMRAVTVMVAFDAEHEKSRPMTQAEIDVVSKALPA